MQSFARWCSGARPRAGGRRAMRHAGAVPAPARRASHGRERCRHPVRTGCTSSTMRSTTRSTRACISTTATRYRRLGQIDAGFVPGFDAVPRRQRPVSSRPLTSRAAATARAPTWWNSPTTPRSPPPARSCCRPSARRPSRRRSTSPTAATAISSMFPYVTPAASFGVLDPAKGTVLGEIDTAGLRARDPLGPEPRVLALRKRPAAHRDARRAGSRSRAQHVGERSSMPTRDPVFVQGIPTTRGFAFLSFLGQVHEVDF